MRGGRVGERWMVGSELGAKSSVVTRCVSSRATFVYVSLYFGVRCMLV